MVSNYIIEESLKANLRDELNEQYTEYKEKVLNDLSWEFEKKRNGIIEGLINSVSIEITREMKSMNPVINISIMKNVIIKENEVNGQE